MIVPFSIILCIHWSYIGHDSIYRVTTPDSQSQIKRLKDWRFFASKHEAELYSREELRKIKYKAGDIDLMSERAGLSVFVHDLKGQRSLCVLARI